MTEEKTDAQAELEPISFATFLQDVAPATWRDVTQLWLDYGASRRLLEAELLLHCSVEGVCERKSYFRCTSNDQYFTKENNKSFFLDYRCSNCQRGLKRFALLAIADEDGEG